MPKITSSARAANTPQRSAFVPETATVDYGHEYPRIDVRPPWLYVYNPRRWTFLAGSIVPQLHKAPLQPGLNGVSKSGNRFELATLKAKIERNGRYPIDFSLGPDGSYLAEVETIAPNGAVTTTYVSAWTETYAGSSATGSDVEGYVQWLQGLMADGHLPKPQPYIVEQLLADRKRSLLDSLSAQQRAPSAARAELIESLREEVKQLEALATDTPKKRAPRKKATPMVD